MIQILIFGALALVAAALGRLVRQMADLRTQVDHVASELSVESSATRLYLGRLSGKDPDLQPAQIDSGRF